MGRPPQAQPMGRMGRAGRVCGAQDLPGLEWALGTRGGWLTGDCVGVGQQGVGEADQQSTAKQKMAGRFKPNSMIPTYLQVQSQTHWLSNSELNKQAFIASSA